VAGQLLAASAAAQAPMWLVAVTGLVGAGIAAGAWVLTSAAVVIAHEGGHAMAASAVGIRVFDIKIHRYGGVTHVDPNITEAKAFVVGLCGYAGPPVLGVAGAILLSTGRVLAVLWLSLVMLACVLWLARDWYSRIATALLGGLILLVLRYTGHGVQTFFAYTWIWFLLIGGLRNVFELSALRATGKDTISDAYKLGQMSYLPAAIFVGFFSVLGFAALIAGGLIMAGALGPAT
jgi:hypothetical protein